MEESMDGAIGVDEQQSWMESQFYTIKAKDIEIGRKIGDLQERIVSMKRDQQLMMHRHHRLIEASQILQLVCQAFQAADIKLMQGNVTTVRSEWESLNAPLYVPDECLVEPLVERIRIFTYEERAPVYQMAIPEGFAHIDPGNVSFRRTLVLIAEMELCMQFHSVMGMIDEHLISQYKVLRMERAQLEDRVKKALAFYGRIKLDLTQYEEECQRLQNILHKSRCALWIPKKDEMRKWSYETREIEERIMAMLSQWQEDHNILCAILDDLRVFNMHSMNDCDKTFYLLTSCKNLYNERQHLIYQLVGDLFRGQRPF